ncbi:MAG: tetratricopeptide repeat protein [Eubacterium sp.]|nr:tetratricopeptide repeat protein [Eubacterium sp.]
MFERQQFYRELDAVYKSRSFDRVKAYLLEQKKRLGVEDIKNSLTVDNELMSLYRGVDRLSESVRIAEHMKEKMREIGFGGTEQYAIVLLNEATAYQKMSKFDAAETLFAECEEILSDKAQGSRYALASLYNNRASLRLAERDYAAALGEGEKALAVLKDLDQVDQERAITLGSMGIACDALGQYAAGEAAVDEAIALYEAAGEGSHLGAVLNIKAKYLCRRGEDGEGAKLFRRAAAVTKKFFGETQDYRICMDNAGEADRRAAEKKDLAKRKK